MGCGTGLAGQYPYDRGFRNIIGVDASRGMLEKSKEKGVYSDLEELYLGSPETFPEKYHGKFDIVTAVGILAEAHLDSSVFDEMLIALKKDGYAFFTTRTNYLTEYRYKEKMDAL